MRISLFCGFLLLSLSCCTEIALAESTWEKDHKNAVSKSLERSKTDEFKKEVEKLKKQAKQKQIEELNNWREQAKNGDIDAISILCFTYTTDQRILSAYENDDKYGPTWCRMGAEKGDALSQISLATLYYQGRGVSKNELEALKYMSQAASSGDPFAQHSLGNYYHNGIGTSKNPAKAAYWHRKSAEQNYADAQIAVGMEYFNGWGVPRDYIEAYAWFNLAASNGSKEGADIRDKIEDTLLSSSEIFQAQERTKKILEGILK